MSLREGIPRFVVFEEEHRAFRSILKRVHEESKARSVLLVDTNGQLVAAWGDTAGLDVTSFASLAASNIAATATMARLVGEKDFTLLFHQGEKDSIHISLVGQRAILAVIFGKEASLSMVRLRVRKAAEEIGTVVEQAFCRMSLRDRLDLSPLCEVSDQDIDDLFSF